MRVLVAGSRDFTDGELLRHIMDTQYGRKTHVLVNGYAKGADRMAYNWAKARWWDIETFLPDWKRFGKRAGFIRNEIMVNSGVDEAILFYGPNGDTPGTKMTEELLIKNEVPFGVYYQEPAEVED